MDPPRGADSDSDGDLAPSFLARRRRRNTSDGEHGIDGRINRHRRHHLHDNDDYEDEDDLDDQDYDGEDGEGDAGVEEEDRLGLAESRLESAEKRLGSAADKRLGPAKNKLGFPKDRLGSAENRLESAENRLESPESRFGKAVGGGKPIGLGFAHNRQRSRREEEEEEDDEEEEEDEEDEEDYEEETDEEEGDGEEDDDEERFNQGKKEESIGGSSSRAKESVASEEKKDSAEPFVVPTAGAFYMHDDRFRRGTGGARRRYSGGGRRQWGGKDEKPWVHDRFEELTLNEEKLSREGARGKGWYKRRGRGRTLGYSQGRNGRFNGSEDRNISSSYYDNKRERGTRRPDSHGTQDSSPTGNKSSGKQQWETMNNSNSPPVSKKRDSLSPRYSASALNSASPAFYPTNSFQQSQTGQGSFQQSQLGQSSGVTKTGSGHNDQSNKKNRDGVQQVGRSVVPSRKAGSLSPSPSSVQITIPSVNSGNNSASNQKGGGNVHTNSGKKQVSKTGAGTPYKKPEVDLQEDGEQLSIAEAVKQMTRLARVHQSVELARAQQSQSSKQGHDSQPHVSSSLTLNQAAPSKLPTSEIANATSSQENKAKNPVSGISSRSSSALQIGRGSLMYGGGHSGGLINSGGGHSGGLINSGGGHSGGLVNSGGGHGGGLVSSGLSSGLRSAVPYGGQPQMGLGMPPVGMALPGYSGQPPFGFGNSEVTWVPILAGTSSTGTGYTPPYVTMDGSTTPFFYTQPAAQPASFNVPGRDLNVGKSSTGLSKVSPRTDIASDKFVQEQSKS